MDKQQDSKKLSMSMATATTAKENLLIKLSAWTREKTPGSAAEKRPTPSLAMNPQPDEPRLKSRLHEKPRRRRRQRNKIKRQQKVRPDQGQGAGHERDARDTAACLLQRKWRGWLRANAVGLPHLLGAKHPLPANQPAPGAGERVRRTDDGSAATSVNAMEGDHVIRNAWRKMLGSTRVKFLHGLFLLHLRSVWRELEGVETRRHHPYTIFHQPAESDVEDPHTEPSPSTQDEAKAEVKGVLVDQLCRAWLDHYVIAPTSDFDWLCGIVTELHEDFYGWWIHHARGLPSSDVLSAFSAFLGDLESANDLSRRRWRNQPGTSIFDHNIFNLHPPGWQDRPCGMKRARQPPGASEQQEGAGSNVDHDTSDDDQVICLGTTPGFAPGWTATEAGARAGAERRQKQLLTAAPHSAASSSSGTSRGHQQPPQAPGGERPADTRQTAVALVQCTTPTTLKDIGITVAVGHALSAVKVVDIEKSSPAESSGLPLGSQLERVNDLHLLPQHRNQASSASASHMDMLRQNWDAACQETSSFFVLYYKEPSLDDVNADRCSQRYRMGTQAASLSAHCNGASQPHGARRRSLAQQHQALLSEIRSFCKCSFCLDLPTGDVLQCDGGHIVCGRCFRTNVGYTLTKEEDLKCVTCRRSLARGPNRSLVAEDLVTALTGLADATPPPPPPALALDMSEGGAGAAAAPTDSMTCVLDALNEGIAFHCQSARQDGREPDLDGKLVTRGLIATLTGREEYRVPGTPIHPRDACDAVGRYMGIPISLWRYDVWPPCERSSVNGLPPGAPPPGECSPPRSPPHALM